jgi:hypothetical protein
MAIICVIKPDYLEFAEVGTDKPMLKGIFIKF